MVVLPEKVSKASLGHFGTSILVGLNRIHVYILEHVPTLD